jgi:hypothetical protein
MTNQTTHVIQVLFQDSWVFVEALDSLMAAIHLCRNLRYDNKGMIFRVVRRTSKPFHNWRREGF